MLNEKVILLTGGGDGIGWECAKAYAGAGAAVCIADKDPSGREKLPGLPGEGHLFVPCDVSDAAAVEKAVDAVISRHGRLDAIHNNAGTASPSKPLDATSPEEWERVLNVNLGSIFLTTRSGIRYLRSSRGCILNTSSLVGGIGQENHAAYVASKGGVNALTKAMALDYAPSGVRVNAVAPAAVNTPMLQSWSREQPDSEAIQSYLDRLQPLGKMPGGDVIADACVFLLSDAARFITGCILPVSGGAELGYRALI